MSAGGEVANAPVCKTGIRGFNSRPALQILPRFEGLRLEAANQAGALVVSARNAHPLPQRMVQP